VSEVPQQRARASASGAKDQTWSAAELYGKRQQIIEPVFGHTKFNRGMDRFHRRGRAAARTEWRLITATHNLLKLWRHTTAPLPA
jgi:DDE family transposase